MAKSLRSRDHRALLSVIRVTRLDAGLTQRELAERLGWPKSKYAAVETGERRLDVVEFKHFAKTLRVDPVALFRRFAEW